MGAAFESGSGMVVRFCPAVSEEHRAVMRCSAEATGGFRISGRLLPESAPQRARRHDGMTRAEQSQTRLQWQRRNESGRTRPRHPSHCLLGKAALTVAG